MKRSNSFIAAESCLDVFDTLGDGLTILSEKTNFERDFFSSDKLKFHGDKNLDQKALRQNSMKGLGDFLASPKFWGDILTMEVEQMQHKRVRKNGTENTDVLSTIVSSPTPTSETNQVTEKLNQKDLVKMNIQLAELNLNDFLPEDSIRVSSRPVTKSNKSVAVACNLKGFERNRMRVEDCIEFGRKRFPISTH